jgi:hypothetical protein
VPTPMDHDGGHVDDLVSAQQASRRLSERPRCTECACRYTRIGSSSRSSPKATIVSINLNGPLTDGELSDRPLATSYSGIAACEQFRILHVLRKHGLLCDQGGRGR